MRILVASIEPRLRTRISKVVVSPTSMIGLLDLIWTSITASPDTSVATRELDPELAGGRLGHGPLYRPGPPV